jgi:hypothetical protein
MNSPDKHGLNPPGQGVIEDDEVIDLRDVFKRLGRGLGQILGLALLGAVVAVAGYFVLQPWHSVSTSTRIVFSFPGLETGEYPDHSKFQADDLRAPEIIAEAVKRQGLDTAGDLPSQIRGALSIQGIISPNIVRDRDQSRAAGQSLHLYTPDEYIVTLTLPDKFPLNKEQRAQLINEMVSIYRENFQRSYTGTPTAFGNAFNDLRNADFPEYEQIFNREIDSITDYLTEQIQQSDSFRSPTTNLSFKDLLQQTQLFARTRLSETLELIYQSGLSRDRSNAMAKMEYAVRILDDQERHAMEDAKVISDLLAKVQPPKYVLDSDSLGKQAHDEAPDFERDLIDSLSANNTYSLLVRRALDAGLKASQVHADKIALAEQLEAMKSAKEDPGAMALVQKSLTELEPAYQGLIDNIRKTQADFARQQFGDAIRLGDAIKTEGICRPLAIAGAVGLFLGLAAGMGLSLLGTYIGPAKKN